MSARRQVWETLGELLRRVDQGLDDRPGDATLEQLQRELRKLGKAQFKANLLAEDQGARWEETLTRVQEAEEQREQLLEAVVEERVADARRELLETVLPALDGVEKAIASGRRYLSMRDRAAAAPNLTAEQGALVSPADRAVLAGWLDGLRLVRERLLAILEAGDVTPIPTVGQPFDPYRHVAVGTTSAGDGPAGTIVAEERRGYQTSAGVLRYAEVIVYRPESDEVAKKR
jgi:molecular chaperone GrpE (heat shock protein)